MKDVIVRNAFDSLWQPTGLAPLIYSVGLEFELYIGVKLLYFSQRRHTDVHNMDISEGWLSAVKWASQPYNPQHLSICLRKHRCIRSIVLWRVCSFFNVIIRWKKLTKIEEAFLISSNPKSYYEDLSEPNTNMHTFMSVWNSSISSIRILCYPLLQSPFLSFIQDPPPSVAMGRRTEKESVISSLHSALYKSTIKISR